ncbi:MAG TPA: sarcosine oxidase subunit alpha family protein [Rhizobiales bacterium]|nr:aminomethyltransferase [bacterium BMS3Bbin10]HDO52118.1 sarcosine oxidase subunit alpha family protein [Hyphomicrobiales bacterium]
MSSFRTAKGGRIKRKDAISFSFEGKAYTGVKGDTLASALLANGVHFVGRSYKYHRPRGIMSAGQEESSALVGIDRGQGRYDTNTRATTQELFEGLKAQSQHCWPSLRWDIGEMNSLASPILSAGFYYKTFMWPKSFWKRVYEPIIRKSAGLGRAPRAVDPDVYASRYAHCDVLIVGGGPAGLAAALAASRSGAKVILADEQSEIGGALLSDPGSRIDDEESWSWLASAVVALAADENVTILNRTTAFGYYHQNFVGLVERLSDHLESPSSNLPRERLWRVRAKRIVLATGAIERPLVFAGNDRPGVMLAGAARTYLNRYGVRVGDKPVVVTSHDSAYLTAFDMAENGVGVEAIIDLCTDVSPELLKGAARLGIEVLPGHTITRTKGRLRISSIYAAPIEPDGSVGPERTIDCDALLMCGGWTPSVHLFSQSRGTLSWREDIGAYVPDVYAQNASSAGACDGHYLLSEALNGGAAAGQAAAIEAGYKAGKPNTYEVAEEATCSGTLIVELPTGANPARIKAFVDFQHDVTAKDIRLAVREGFHSIEHIKRYTTAGMATDQGKTSNLSELAIASKTLSRPIAEVGLTTFRPPYTPTSFGAFAGRSRGNLFDVTRKSPIDSWAEKRGAVFEPVSLWRRARYFPRDNEDMHAAVARECKATRSSIGISDASTLGKIEVVGPDSAEFLNRIYTNAWTKLGVGRCRYGLMLGEDGFIFDDGVVGRLALDRFHVTTTTGGAPRVMAHMEDYLQTEWPDLDLWLTSITEQWAVIALNGPNVRKLIEPFVEGIDLDKQAFPHMAIKEGKIYGVPTRLFRVSFTGELGFEINVPSRYGLTVWKRLIEEGARYDIVPYGTEALHVLRAEKGYIIVGQDTDGTQTPDDVGMAWAIGRNKHDFIGKRSLTRPDMLVSNRKQLVGLLTRDPKNLLEEGAQIVATAHPSPPAKMIGHVTSSYWSETLQHSIAMGVVEGGRARMGAELYVPMPDGVHQVQVVEPVFYDQEGGRLNV